MARAKKLDIAGPGHNGPPLTEEEASALTIHYQLKIQADQRKVDVLVADLGGARKVVNGHFKRLSADLGFTRKEFEAEVLAKLNMTPEAFANSEKRRNRLYHLAGLKEGQQIDLVEMIKDTVDDAMAAESVGYLAGRRGDDPSPIPSEISPIFHTDWQRGWTRGQEVNAKAEAMAAEIMARPRPGTMVAGDDPDEEEEDDGSPEALKAAAQALKDSGWVGPTEAEAEFEEADGGRTIRTPRTNGRAPAEAGA